MLVGPVTSSSQETWQQRVILASQSYILSEDDSPGDSGHSDDDFVELFGSLIDNSSHQCPSVCIPCPDDQPLWYLVLRWLKMLLLKIARSYHAKPLILVIAPLVVGISVGYWLGARKEPASKNSMNYQSSTGRLFTSLCWKLRDLIALVCFRTGAWWALGSEDSSVTPNISEYKLESCTAEKCPVATSGKSKKFVEKEDRVRENLKSEVGTLRESGVHVTQVPRHVAVIMDGNRRYGKAKYGNISKGHWDGSSKLVEFAKWCIAEQVSVLTVYAFSTENWNRDPAEVTALMAIFSKYCDELRVEALKRNIRIMVLSTDTRRVSKSKRREVGETTPTIYSNVSHPNWIHRCCVLLPVDTSSCQGWPFAYDGRYKALHWPDHEYLPELR